MEGDWGTINMEGNKTELLRGTVSVGWGTMDMEGSWIEVVRGTVWVGWGTTDIIDCWVMGFKFDIDVFIISGASEITGTYLVRKPYDVFTAGLYLITDW